MKKILAVIFLMALTCGAYATAGATATACYNNVIATQTPQAYIVNGVATTGQANAVATATPGISNAVATETAVGAASAATAACTINQVNATSTQAAINTGYTATETAVRIEATQTGTVTGGIAAWTATEAVIRTNATAAVTAAMETATTVQNASNTGATATITAVTGTYNSTTQSVDTVFGAAETAVATSWAAGIATVRAQATRGCGTCDAIASFTATQTPTLTPTATMPTTNGNYFQSTPTSGQRQIVFNKCNVQDVYIDSISTTPCSVDFYAGNTYTAIRHVYISDISKPVRFYGRYVSSLYIDYGLNTGTSTVISGLSGTVITQATPGTSVVAVATKVNVDKIIIDSLVNTDCVIKIADGSAYLVNVSITALPAVIPFYGRYFTTLNINYGTKTGTSYVVVGGVNQSVLYQPTPQAGPYTVPTPGTFGNAKIDKISVDYLFGEPGQINIYNGTVLFKTENIYSTPWVISMGGAVMSGLRIDYGINTGTAEIILK